MTCHLGDFEEYARLRRDLKDRETELAKQGAAQRRAAAAVALEKLKPGDVIHVPTGKFAGLALVLDPGLPAGRSNGHRGFEYHDGPRPLVLTAERQVKRLASMDFPVPVEPLERMRIPKSFNPRSPQSRRDLASALRTKAGHIVARAAPQAARRRPPTTGRSPGCARSMRAHPCHGCDEREDHARWAERYHRLQRDTRQLERRIEGRTNTIARTFDRIVRAADRAGLPARATRSPSTASGWPGSTASWTCWPANACATGVWEGLGPAELAACVSALVYEARAGRRRGGAQGAGGQGEGRARRDGAHLGPAGRPGGGVPDQPGRGRGPARARPRLRLGRVPVGLRARAWTRCCARRRCRPATSCAGASRSSTCWARSRRRRPAEQRP